jgi:hypothetical protein
MNFSSSVAFFQYSRSSFSCSFAVPIDIAFLSILVLKSILRSFYSGICIPHKLYLFVPLFPLRAGYFLFMPG